MHYSEKEAFTMSKQNRRLSPFQTIDLSAFEKRPVTKADKWCEKKGLQTGHVRSGSAPWGYIVTIPYLPSKDSLFSGYDGYIVRTKKHCGKFLLQVLPRERSNAVYGVQSFGRNEPHISKAKRRKKKQLFRILHPRNLIKSELQW